MRPGASERWSVFVGPSPHAPWKWEVSLQYNEDAVSATKWSGFNETREGALADGFAKMHELAADPPPVVAVVRRQM